MSNPVNRIVGLRVQKALNKEGSLFLGLEAAMELVIHNQYAMHPSVGVDDLLRNILGCEITAVKTNDDSIEISIGGISLLVDLKSAAWSGPEAAVLYEGEMPLVVWS